MVLSLTICRLKRTFWFLNPTEDRHLDVCTCCMYIQTLYIYIHMYTVYIHIHNTNKPSYACTHTNKGVHVFLQNDGTGHFKIQHVSVFTHILQRDCKYTSDRLPSQSRASVRRPANNAHFQVSNPSGLCLHEGQFEA